MQTTYVALFSVAGARGRNGDALTDSCSTRYRKRVDYFSLRFLVFDVSSRQIIKRKPSSTRDKWSTNRSTQITVPYPPPGLTISNRFLSETKGRLEVQINANQ